MGCFSFKCKECGTPINSTSFDGEKVRLYLLQYGRVIETQVGRYDSYGRVFLEGSQRSDVKHPLMKSVEWDMDWGEVCDLMFADDKSNGIAAVHEVCFKDRIPNRRSKDDPNQGWGDLREKFC